MTADVVRIHEHECVYKLRVGDRWVSASKCCWGQVLDLPAPGTKPTGRAA